MPLFSSLPIQDMSENYIDFNLKTSRILLFFFSNSTVIILDQNAIFSQPDHSSCHLIDPPASTFDPHRSALNAATEVILISHKTRNVIPLFTSLPSFAQSKCQRPQDSLQGRPSKKWPQHSHPLLTSPSISLPFVHSDQVTLTFLLALEQAGHVIPQGLCTCCSHCLESAHSEYLLVSPR